MNTEDVTLDVGGDRYPGRLNVPDCPSERGVLVVPGVSHGPFGDVFDRFADGAAETGHHVARFETWENKDDLAEKTVADYEAELDVGIEFLRSRGCETIAIVAKSFGGRLALTHCPEGVDRMVLWAPAILVGGHDDWSIDASELAEIEIPIRVLQGNEDEVVSVEEAERLVEHLPNGELVELSGEDHSFSDDEERVVERTLSFLSG